LIEIEPVNFNIETETDWIFISSSNGARILLESYYPTINTKIGVVGAATGKTVKQFGFEPTFIGTPGDMEKVGAAFAKVLGHDSVLFVGADGGSEKLRNCLHANQVSFVPIYSTKLLTNQDLPITDVVYLTSPSNAEAYLSVNSLIGKTVIVIGNTTAEFLELKGIENILIPKSPKEEDVVELIKSL
jgi:uroporphyrinogen-III synthase